MICIVKKGDTYAADVRQARNLVKFKKLILIFPTVVLAVLAIALAIVLKNVALLLIAVAAVAYVVVMLATLPSLYKKLCGNIAQKYMEYYKTPEGQRQALLSCASGSNAGIVNPNGYPLVLTKLKEDNVGFCNSIGQQNMLYFWLDNDCLKAISILPIGIATTKYTKMSVSGFDGIIGNDFGRFEIPVNEVDHYRENTLVCAWQNGNLLKLKFENATMMDALIPRKDFYYQSKKKSDVD